MTTTTPLLRPTEKPSPRLPISSLFIWVGLFTISWDRFATVQAGSFNVKVPAIMFALGLLLTITDRSVMGRIRGTRQPIVFLMFAAVAYFAAIGLAADNIVYAQLQTVTVLLGAVIPFLAVYLNVRVFGSLDQALTAFIRGGWFAAIFGLYQLGAFYTGLPQIVSYDARGGSLGRISAFSYEAGYFGYFLILVIGAVFARAALRGQAVKPWHIVFLFVVLLLANSRASFLTIPLFLVLMFWRWPSKAARPKMIGWAFFLTVAAVVFAVLQPATIAAFAERAATLFDPTEASSNAPRLAVNASSAAIAGDHFWTGIGAGNLVDYMPLYGGTVLEGATSNSVIANNVYYQGILDGGIFLLLLQLTVVVYAVRTYYRRTVPVSRALMAGWIAAFFVSSFITSFYWDIKLWVVLALAVAARSLIPPIELPGRDRNRFVFAKGPDGKLVKVAR